MKKIVAIILSSVILFVIATVSAVSATTDTKSADQGDVASPKLTKVFSDAMKNGKFYMRYITIATDANGQQMRTKGVSATDGKSMFFEMGMEQMDMKIKSLIKDGNMHLIDDATKTYIVLPPKPGSEQKPNTNNFASIKFTGSGTGTIEGKTLPYEEYASDDNVMRYYVDGPKIYAIEAEDGDGNKTIMLIEEFSTDVPEELLNLPEGYTKAL